MTAREQALIRVRTLASADIETESERLLVTLAAEVESLTAQLQAAQEKIGQLRLISNVNGDWNVKYATAKADGWDEGYSRGREDHCDWWGGPDECDVATPNPYRAAIEQEGAE